MISIRNAAVMDCERLLPIVHSSDIEFVRSAFKLFMPRSLQDAMRGDIKLAGWRQHQMDRLAPKPRLDIVRHLLTTNEPPKGSMLQILELEFVVKIKDLGILVSSRIF